MTNSGVTEITNWRGVRLTDNFVIAWHDGPCAGVARINGSTEEYAYEELAVRYNPNGNDARLVEAWGVPSGTLDFMISNTGFTAAFFQAAKRRVYSFHDSGDLIEELALEGSFQGRSELFRPHYAHMLLVITGEHVRVAWKTVCHWNRSIESCRYLLLSAGHEE